MYFGYESVNEWVDRRTNEKFEDPLPLPVDTSLLHYHNMVIGMFDVTGEIPRPINGVDWTLRVAFKRPGYVDLVVEYTTTEAKPFIHFFGVWPGQKTGWKIDGEMINSLGTVGAFPDQNAPYFNDTLPLVEIWNTHPTMDTQSVLSREWPLKTNRNLKFSPDLVADIKLLEGRLELVDVKDIFENQMVLSPAVNHELSFTWSPITDIKIKEGTYTFAEIAAMEPGVLDINDASPVPNANGNYEYMLKNGVEYSMNYKFDSGSYYKKFTPSEGVFTINI